jgi:hypothetical protein
LIIARSEDGNSAVPAMAAEVLIKSLFFILT